MRGRWSRVHRIAAGLSLAVVHLGLLVAPAAGQVDPRGVRIVGAAGLAEEPRLALVIGNARYERVPLRNPVNDANDIAKALESLDFEVILTTNANQEEMETAIRTFGDRLGGGVGLFYCFAID